MTADLVLQALTMRDLESITEYYPEFRWQQPKALADVPRERGVYVWLTADGRVLYIGKGSGKGGLRGRIREEWSGKIQAKDVADELTSRRTQLSIYRLLALHDASPWVAVVEDEAIAKQWERNLIHLAIWLTGVRPPLNGGGWVPKGANALADQWAGDHFERLQPALVVT